MNVLPGPFQCSGKCGDGEVCSPVVAAHGYCRDPRARKEAANRGCLNEEAIPCVDAETAKVRLRSERLHE